MNSALPEHARSSVEKGEVKFFISDLHLGDGSGADDFNYTNEFLKFLDFAKVHCQELIIVGDLFELWQCDLDKIIFHHNRVIKALFSFAKNKQLTYVIGNHDHIPFVKYINSDIGVKLKYHDEKLKLHAEHGNQYDIFNRYKNPMTAAGSPWGKIISYICGWAERTIHPDIDEWSTVVAGIKNKVPPTDVEYSKRGGDLSEYEKAAQGIISEGNKIVIFGHTHQAKITRFNKGIYANCGAWCGSVKPTYIAVKNERVELRDGVKHTVLSAEGVT